MDSATIENHKEFTRVDDRRFGNDIDALIRSSEHHRLKFMKEYRSREVMATSLGLGIITLGGCGFGWFFLMQADLVKALACMVIAICVPLFLNIWAEGPLKAYVKDHKQTFMPQMAKALGGMKFYATRGISAKIIARTGIIPPYDEYKAEDCFMGKYKGVKVIFSEARLKMKKKSKMVFDGIFVLMELPDKIFEGHTIVTADKQMAERYSVSRWKNLHHVPLQTSNNSWDRFEVYSDQPEAAGLIVGEKLLKELSEAADIFDYAPLSAVFFKGKYVFMAIPYAKDMFEASNIYVPVATKKHAMNCKREIEQLLEVIDVFDIYQNKMA